MVQWLRLRASTWNSAQCYVAAWMGEGFGGEWIHVYVRLSPIAVYLTLGRHNLVNWLSIQFSSVAQLCLTLCDPMNHSTPGLPVHHQLVEFT